MSAESNIQVYLSKDEGFLYREIYSAAFPNAGMSGGNEEQATERGKKVFNSYIVRLRPLLCPRSEELIKRCEGDPVQLVILIADVVAAALVGVPAIMISVLVVKIGIRKVCQVPS